MYSTRRFVLSLALCYFVIGFFSPFSIAITLLWEERVNLSAFRTFVQFALVWFCLFPLPFGVLDGLRLVIVALPGLFLPISGVVCSLYGLVATRFGAFSCFVMYVVLLLCLVIMSSSVIILLGNREMLAWRCFSLVCVLSVLVLLLFLLASLLGYVLWLCLFLDIFYTFFYYFTLVAIVGVGVPSEQTFAS